MKSLILLSLMTLALAGPSAAQDGPAAIMVGQTLNGDLNTQDLQAPDSTYYDLYRFRAEAGVALTITLTATEFDGHLALQKAGTTNTVAADDNGGGGKNAKITYTPTEAADLDIRATATDAGLGAYVLKIETAR